MRTADWIAIAGIALGAVTTIANVLSGVLMRRDERKRQERLDLREDAAERSRVATDAADVLADATLLAEDLTPEQWAYMLGDAQETVGELRTRLHDVRRSLAALAVSLPHPDSRDLAVCASVSLHSATVQSVAVLAGNADLDEARAAHADAQRTVRELVVSIHEHEL